jgi:nucleoid DNA-binding protein
MEQDVMHNQKLANIQQHVSDATKQVVKRLHEEHGDNKNSVGRSTITQIVHEALSGDYPHIDVERICMSLLMAIQSLVIEYDKHVQIRTFGTFEPKKTQRSIAHNPQTGDEVEPRHYKRIKFIPGKYSKVVIN